MVEGASQLSSARVTVTADLQIARGLDYYTGTVYETRMQGLEHLGSVCSGGRYESLASNGSTTYPGVGISFGVTRTLAPLLTRGVLAASRTVPSACWWRSPTTPGGPRVCAWRRHCARAGSPVEVAPSAEKFGKQIRYADRRGIPYVWFLTDEGDQVKDIRSGEQVDADPSVWMPPQADLTPQIVVSGEETSG